MNNAIVALIISSLAGISTVIGGLVVFIKFKDRIGFISFALSFSLSVMVSISIFDLLPNSIITLYEYFGLIPSFFLGVGVFLIGRMLVLKVSSTLLIKKESSLYRVGILSMLALIIHNFPEGIATFMSAYTDLSVGISLGIAIMLHNIPEGISISVPIYYSTGSKLKGVLYSLISGIAEPLGAIIAYLLLKNFINEIIVSLVLILVSGIMLTLAIDEMLEEVNSYKRKKLSIIGLLLGFIIVLINVIFF